MGGKFVGLQIVVDFKKFGKRAMLQRRGEVAYEINDDNTLDVFMESFPGVCQNTVNGELEENERKLSAPECFHAGILREVNEELGFGPKSWLLSSDFLKNMKELHYSDDGKRVVAIYGLEVPEDFLKALPQSSLNSFIFVGEADLDNIIEINTTFKKAGICRRDVIGMFPEDKAAVRQALAVFNITKKEPVVA